MNPFRKETQSGSKNMASAFSWFNHSSKTSGGFKANRSWLSPSQLARTFALVMIFVVYREAQHPSLSRSEAAAYLRPWATQPSAIQLFLGASCFLFAWVCKFFPAFSNELPKPLRFAREHDVARKFFEWASKLAHFLSAGRAFELLIGLGLAISYPNLLIWVLLCLALCCIRIYAHQGNSHDGRGGLVADLGLGHLAGPSQQVQGISAAPSASFERGLFLSTVCIAFLNAACALTRSDLWGTHEYFYAAPLFLFSAAALFLKKTELKRAVTHAI